MADDTTSTATPAADSSLIDTALAESKSFLSKAQETLTNAAESAVAAAKEHPIAAAGIAAGAAAAVAGAAFGASKLRSDDTTTSTAPKGAKKKS